MGGGRLPAAAGGGGAGAEGKRSEGASVVAVVPGPAAAGAAAAAGAGAEPAPKPTPDSPPSSSAAAALHLPLPPPLPTPPARAGVRRRCARRCEALAANPRARRGMLAGIALGLAALAVLVVLVALKIAAWRAAASAASSAARTPSGVDAGAGPSAAPTASSSPSTGGGGNPTQAPALWTTGLPTLTPNWVGAVGNGSGWAPTPQPTPSPSGPPAPPRKRNVLLIICDDLKPLLPSFNRSPWSQPTPNMDRLVNRGVRFWNAHAQFSDCSPSRASFLTSLRPDTTRVYGVGNNELYNQMTNVYRQTGKTMQTLPAYLKANGYLTYGVGKVFHENEWQLMRDPNTWTEPVFTWQTSYARPPSFISPYSGAWVSGDLDVPDTYFTDGQAFQLAAQLVTRLANQSQPWFLAMGGYKPHLPFQAPKRYFDAQFPVASFPQASTTGAPAGTPSGDWPMIRGMGCLEVRMYADAPSNLASWATSAPVQRAAIQAYHAAVSYMDAQIGVLLDALDASPAAMHTHVFLLGDHGFHLGCPSYGVFCKHTTSEQGTRTPLIVAPALSEHWPLRGRGSPAPVELLDLMPTVADMLGLPAKRPGAMAWQGVSLAPIMRGAAAFVKSAAVSQYPRGSASGPMWGYSIRTVRYRFTTWCPAAGQFNPSFFACVSTAFDYLADRFEQVNLFPSRKDLKTAFIGSTAQGGAVQWVGVNRFNYLAGRMPFDAADAGNMTARYFQALWPLP